VNASAPRRRLRACWLAAVALLAACAAGCAGIPRADPHLLDFLDGPAVTRAQVLGRLGPDHALYENGRVVAYRIGMLRSGYYVSTRRKSWKGVDYDLMLVFNAQDVLEQNRLISIRSAASPR
jgi:hypothetical protein